MVNPTPTSTRTYNDKQQQVAREHFDASHLVAKWQPTVDEMATVIKAAVAMSAYRAEKGRLSPFPSPFSFFGTFEDTPPLPRHQSHRECGLLKLALRLRSELQKQVDTGATDEVVVSCPDCGEQSILCHIGVLPTIDRERWTIVPNQKPRLIALTMECSCRGLGTAHYNEIETSALRAYIAKDS